VQLTKVVAVHQPNFYPWLGFFDKWARADVFVLLDDVQFPKTGGVWTNRSGIAQEGKKVWFTAPISRSFSGVVRVNEIHLLDDSSWREKLVRKFAAAYRSAPFRDEGLELLVADVLGAQTLLVDLNLASLMRLGSLLGLDREKIILSSALDITASSTERLVQIVQQSGGTTYLAGGGAQGYQQDEDFAKKGLHVDYQDFRHPLYEQTGTESFIPGLSILDSLSQLGVSGTRELLSGTG
jgi:hypothetical protein